VAPNRLAFTGASVCIPIRTTVRPAGWLLLPVELVCRSMIQNTYTSYCFICQLSGFSEHLSRLHKELKHCQLAIVTTIHTYPSRHPNHHLALSPQRRQCPVSVEFLKSMLSCFSVTHHSHSPVGCHSSSCYCYCCIFKRKNILLVRCTPSRKCHKSPGHQRHSREERQAQFVLRFGRTCPRQASQCCFYYL